MARAERILWYCNFAATLVLLIRIVICRLHQIYPWTFRYWLGQAAATAVLLAIPLSNGAYFFAYVAAQSINLTLSVFVLQELYATALAAHPGLSVFGRRSMLAVLAAAGTLALAGLGVDSTVMAGQYWRIHRFLTLTRTVEFVILVFLLVISAFLLWFPVKIRRNVAVYIAGFFFYYVLQASVFLSHNLLPQKYSQAISMTSLIAALISLLIWLVGLRAESATPATVSGHGWNPLAAARLSVELNGINAALTRLVRKPASLP
jgi:hypothetical protein